MEYNIDFETLREDLINYFGTALFNASPLAIINITQIERAREEELIKIAKDNCFDLNKYKNNSRNR